MLLGRGSTLVFRLGLVLSGAVFASICSVISADGREKEGQSDPIPLTIKEIHKVKRADDPSGRQQNIKVVLDPHDPVLDAETYILSLETLDNGTVQYEAVHIPDPTATEVEFEGNFLDATEVVIQAAKDGTTLAYGAVDAEVKDPGSRVAWVGDSVSPSLRVDPGRRGQVEVPGQAPCEGSSDSNPCYYFGYSHQPLEPPLPRCDDFGPVLFCDDIVTELESRWRVGYD